ncbi:carboxy terminal-processing peptidase [Aureibaculum sp. 2210JD6-5]|uniref:carboxy terminal-processing peptidase n=1 Tax=Aureibaculum sp. 2210JD6-5 TaxID=3103957 RepID=UPI002AAEEAB2|nr:carboxy terminal-processing peptidase [Aureibaculum sp. 2210JD6-5]MDY7395708.1 carboxy terminal-processing peptidase [Aureibaculum sp. 2210JD6-5]
MKKIIKFMKSNYKIILPVILLAGILLSFNIKQKQDPEKEKILLGLIRSALTQGHYQPHEIDDEFSNAVYTNFIEGLDPAKRFFTQEDIKEFEKYKLQIDDQIKAENLSFYRVVTSKYLQRVQEAKGFYKEILKHPFDFSKDEIFDIDYDKKEYPKNEVDLIINWQKQFKLTTLSRLHSKIEAQEDKQKEDANAELKTFTELEIEAREATLKSMEEFFDYKDDEDDEDWYSIFINSISTEFDPHTTYFAPRTKKKFDIDMTGKIEGIGARLQRKGEYTRVDELISGGPAWRDGNLEVGDIITKVAQADGEPLDIVGMRLDDAIEFIKGKKGTEVRLTVKKLDGSTQVIPIIRDVVEIEETFAKTSIVKKDGRKFGVIDLPKFYIDFSERNFRNSASDMALEVERLNKENVEGLVIDLRNNGGGSLDTAIDIAGLFIEEGPIVQVKYKDGKPKIRSDKDYRIQWNKPLVIIVNEISASASEIFAAAMQDYNRAVIIGSKQTYGKGTVQNYMALNRYFDYDKDLGALKLTIQKFYRVNGGSTQLKGVVSDVALPDRYAYMNIGERDETNSLKWDKIESAEYKVWDGYSNFDEAVNNSKKRVVENEQFRLIDNNAKWLKEGQDDTTVYLNYEKYKEDLKNREEQGNKFKAMYEYKNDLSFTSPSYEVESLKQDSILAKKREIWHKNLSKDIYVEEALNIVADLKVKKEKTLVKN